MTTKLLTLQQADKAIALAYEAISKSFDNRKLDTECIEDIVNAKECGFTELAEALRQSLINNENLSERTINNLIAQEEYKREIPAKDFCTNKAIDLSILNPNN